MAEGVHPAATAPLHPAAIEHLPGFVTAPGNTDILLVVTGIVLLAGVVGFGILFLTLHTLPERMAHKSQKLQFEIVAVLGLIALFTHMHIFWVAGLLLALIDLPDFGGWLSRISASVERIADAAHGKTPVQAPEGTIVVDGKHGDDVSIIPHDDVASRKRGDGVVSTRTGRAPETVEG